MSKQYPNLFEPIKIGSVEIKNRYMLAPMGPGGFCDADGSFNERGVEFYVERARGGAGLIMPGVTMVENEIEQCALPSMPCPTLNPINFIKTAKLMTERIHAYDAKIFLQLSAGFGRVSIPSIVGRTAVAPSEIPHRWIPGVTCRALTIEEIKTYIRKFADSAEISQKAGFDGVEIHAVHEGYLLDQFAISFFNRRTDEYGGSLENRLRFATDIVKAIKERCGQDFPVSLRYSIKSFIKDWLKGGLPGEEFEEKGRDIEEGIEAAKILEAAGYDALNGDVGSYDSWYWSHPPMYQDKGLYLPYNEILKNTVKIPIITAGRMDDPELASRAIAEGKTDMIGLARPLLADADIPNKVKAGKAEKIRPCLSCQEGCMGRLAKFTSVSCAVNPAAGREKDYALIPALIKKKVMIVGGGVAGMEAARVAKLRGHEVELFEASDKLGGVVLAGGVPDFKEDDFALLDWYRAELEELKINVHLNSPVGPDTFAQHKPDTVIMATGSKARMLEIPGADNVYTATDVLLGRKDPGDTILIIGGGLVGCETALWLHNMGKKVYMVELQDGLLQLAGPLCHANSEMLLELMRFKKIEIFTSSKVVEQNADGFVIHNQNLGEKTTIKADSAILAVGYHSERSLFDEVKNQLADVHLIGDSRQVQNIMYAVWDAYEVARSI
ncbi:FAD-dependent oxidoreductase [Gynuella sunshinyii]|uniref:NADH:flavin oxidoreductase, Old Yellow Enzyme family n=1 Tax=Gynuella sunshinyii YC6258 TaxID=1445510 RepID=A0A0C5VV56_9GAMM|nr:FAD-dependent oxidoreductase [Gynuella sunshinyii]AJQ94274.1 NADH:flavin oxidoreductase, Old Yellow Enzyme family [Gynuella sunshinyii YC6258]